MPAYREGTTPEGLTKKLREDFAALCAAIQAQADPEKSWADGNTLVELMGQLEEQAAAFKGWLLVYWMQNYHLSRGQLAKITGISRPRVSILIQNALEKGNPVSEATTTALPKWLVLAVITSSVEPNRGVLIGRRKDEIPPMTFIGGEQDFIGETYHQVAARRVLAETGLIVTSTEFVGTRIHPRTGIPVAYVHAKVENTNAVLTDEGAEDLRTVEWVSVADTRKEMPDMFAPVRQYLDALAAAMGI